MSNNFGLNSDDFSNYLKQLLYNYNRYFERLTVPFYEEKLEHQHRFIPSHGYYNLIKSLLVIRKHIGSKRMRTGAGVKFLDCGCGIGNILLVADMIGFEVFGIEYNIKTAELGRELLRNILSYRPEFRAHNRIIVGDLLTFKSYRNYDVVYYYQPMWGRKFFEFIEKLSSDMKLGSYIIANGNKEVFDISSKFARVSKNTKGIYPIFKKIKKGKVKLESMGL